MKHALAEKRRAEADAVEAADEFAREPDLDRMRLAARVQRGVEPHDLGVDPGFLALRAGFHHLRKCVVGGHFEAVGAHDFGQALGDDQAVERKDAAPFRLDPMQFGVVAVLGHGEQADGIGAQQQVRGDLERRLAARHGERVARRGAGVKIAGDECKARLV